MSDLVEMIRAVASRTNDVEDHVSIHLAADEIERLQKLCGQPSATVPEGGEERVSAATPSPHDLVEIVARADYEKNSWWKVVEPGDDGRGRYKDGFKDDRFRAIEWSELPEEDQQMMVANVRSIATAIEKAGYRIVPVEPPREFVAAGTWGCSPGDREAMWSFVLSAAPKVVSHD